jgi:hypothetical protein
LGCARSPSVRISAQIGRVDRTRQVSRMDQDYQSGEN